MEEQKKDWTAEKLPRGKDYFLISEGFVKAMKLPEGSVSKPVEHPILKINVFVAIAALEDLENKYNELEGAGGLWAREVQESNVAAGRIKYLTIKRCQKRGLFKTIEAGTGATDEKNVACVIGSIAKMQGVTPIELFDQVSQETDPDFYKKLLE